MVARFVERLRASNERITATCIGIVYFWFGFLKFFPGSSPAEHLAKNTIHSLTFGMVPDNLSYFLLAIWETGVGMLFILNIRRKWVIHLALLHMICTFTPLIFFPEASFTGGSLTLTGQYIIKNLIIIAALLSIYPAGSENACSNAIGK